MIGNGLSGKTKLLFFVAKATKGKNSWSIDCQCVARGSV